MRNVTLSPRRASRAPISHTISCHTDGAVTVRRSPRISIGSVRCAGCLHLRRSEEKLGFTRSGCELGHFGTPEGVHRRFSDHEMAYPSTFLFSIAKACRDYSPAGSDAA